MPPWAALPLMVRPAEAGLGHRLSARAAAQEATPLTEPVGIEGVDLGSGQPTSIPEMELVLRRTTIAPGGGIPPHSHPGSIVLVVDAGTWGYTPLGGTIQLTRAAVDGTPAPTEEVPIGTASAGVGVPSTAARVNWMVPPSAV